MSDVKPLYAYFGHHKCASTWIQNIIGRVCQFLQLKVERINSDNNFNGNLNSYLIKNNIEFLSYSNANFRFVSQLGSFKGFHVIRDPRDIAVSSYFSHLYSHDLSRWDELTKHRKILERMTLEEGLLYDMEFIKWNYENISSWNYLCDNILEIRMEDLIQNPYELFADIFEFFGLLKYPEKSSDRAVNENTNIRKLPIQRLLYMAYTNRFSAKAGGRKTGEEDNSSHYRKGISGDWKNYFTPKIINIFKYEYGELLVMLGYEKDLSWK